MISKLKARLREEWREIGPFIVAGFLEVLLNAIEALIFVGLPLLTIAVVFIFATHFFRVCAL